MTNKIKLFTDLNKFVGPITGEVLYDRIPASYNDEIMLFKTNYFYFNDEKKLIRDNSTGMGLNLFDSKLKALVEAIERKYTTKIENHELKIGSKSSIEKSIDPEKFFALTEENLRPSKKDIFKWVRAKDIINENIVWLPAQLVFVPYRIYDEKMLRPPITTGCAAWSDNNTAILKGIFELVERDAFMITWLCKKKPNAKLKLGKYLPDIFRRNDFIIELFDITIDFCYPTVFCILTDKRGKPAITTGLKTDKNEKDAAIGALMEAVQTRGWIRDNLQAPPKEVSNYIVEHGLKWSDKKMKKYLRFLKCNKIRKIGNKKETSDRAAMKNSINYFKKNKYDIYYCKLSDGKLEKNNLFIVKCISPQLVPLYLDEKYKCWNSERLRDNYLKIYGKRPQYKDFNQVVHPFL